MAYRNGTYVAFHANGTSEPTESDFKYYGLMKAWKVREEGDFSWVDSHEKGNAVRDSSKKATLEQALRLRLRSSKHLVLIIGNTTKEDTDWIPFEIAYAVDDCNIPIIAAYTGYNSILDPAQLAPLWPAALADRIRKQTVKVLHIPFKQQPLKEAVGQFHFENMPNGSLSFYNREAQVSWGLIAN